MTDPSLSGPMSWLARAWDRALPWARQQWVGIALASAALVLVAGALIFVRVTEQAPGPAASVPDKQASSSTEVPPASLPAHSSPAEQGEAIAAPAAAPTVIAAPSGDAGAPPSATVKVVFKTVPSRRASVMWGGTRLGYIDRNKPLVVERPRDSGPLDVVIRSPGYLPVHARAYTFDDDLVEVRITPVDKKDTLFGYKAPLPPEDAGAPLP